MSELRLPAAAVRHEKMEAEITTLRCDLAAAQEKIATLTAALLELKRAVIAEQDHGSEADSECLVCAALFVAERALTREARRAAKEAM